MTTPKNLSAFSSQFAAFETALAHGGGSMQFPTAKEAAAFRLKMHKYRAALRRSNAKAMGVSEEEGTCPYDHFVIRLDMENATLIFNNVPVDEFKFTAPDGTAVDMQAASEPTELREDDIFDDDLEAAAQAFAAQLRKGEE